ncbi:gephyrin-like molybdotransferase Glp [Candidatus Solincola tengchongensis]|uniref:molybdopterin molybdotransferase MoeA n=1 Tax=Candidatus Solincola tengchongensis TaxID=2900693 RepID=UPI00257EF1C9|nr:gephyrin-like molybdotransferase Glp [Candidatus Solincola tengchongensis]
MLSVEEARRRVLEAVSPLEVVEVPLLEALGMTLAEDAVAGNDIPPFDNSAMDGYAVRAEDVSGAADENPVELEVLGDLPAGYTAEATVGPGQALRIMTGAPLPAGADAVVPVERTRAVEGRVLVLEGVSRGDNVRRAGEDVRAGERVIASGTLVGPAELGMLASLGHARARCFRRAVVGIISTGDELVEVGEELSPGKIRDSNSYTVYGMVLEAGGIPLRLGIVRDDAALLERTILENLDRVDLFVTSGGVSVGDYDMVKDVLGKLGEMNFWKVAMRPGKPQAFGHIGGKPLFGLPGNPVSVMVSFEQFVRPALLKMMGRSSLFRPQVTAVLDAPIGRRTGRTEFIRVIAEWREGRYHVRPTGPQGSGILKSMVLGNALAVLPEEVGRLEPGAEVTVQLLRP